ncbi:MAG: PrsW family glutamic-type intramembrane protease [Polyangiaceae bacterium]
MPRSLRWFVALILLASAAGGIFADRLARARRPLEARAAALAHAGKYGDAETLYFSQIEHGSVTVPIMIAFLDAHRYVNSTPLDEDGRPDLIPIKAKKSETVRDHAIDVMLERTDISPDVALLGRYWNDVGLARVSEDERQDVERAADADPPMPWANHLLARESYYLTRNEEAAERYLREGVLFDRHADIDSALAILEATGGFPAIGAALGDPRVNRLASPWMHFRYAVEVRDWKQAFRWSWVSTFDNRFTLGPLLLAIVSGLAWLVFSARLGRIGERPLVRGPLYLAAFALGMISVYPTDVLIAVQESTLHLEHTGEAFHDILYFLFGVGFREELSKLLLFVPLLPILLRGFRRGWVTKLDVLVCGTLVGLGFAAVENLLYFEREDLSTAMARFLTANFFHMSMTALTSAALFEFAREPDKHSFEFSKTLFTVMALHGAYDFFLSARGGASYLAMGVFILLAQRFTSAVSDTRESARGGLPLLHIFISGMAFVIGTSFVYASWLVGPTVASAVLVEGMFGLAIVLFFFIQELRKI